MSDDARSDIMMELPLIDRLHIDAVEYHLDGEYDDAIRTYERILKFQPENAEVRYHYGIALGTAKSSELALEQYYIALLYDEKMDDVLREAGLILLAQGKAYEALDMFLRWDDLRRGQHQPRYYAGCALALGGDLDEAITQFWVALSREKVFAPSKHGIAVASHLKGDYRKANEEYRKAIALEPNNPFFRFHYAITLDAQDYFDLAATELRVAIALDPMLAHVAPVMTADIWRNTNLDIERHDRQRAFTLSYLRFGIVYGWARRLAMENDIIGALDFLREARTLRYFEPFLVRQDKAFANLRDLVAFKEILGGRW